MKAALRRLLAITRKEVKQLRRDRLTFGMIVGLPLLQILLFGYAIDTDVRHLVAAAADQANTSGSRELLRAIGASQVGDIEQQVAGPNELKALLDAGKIDVGIFIPPDFERRLQDGNRPAAQLFINGSDPTIEGIARQLARMPAPFSTARENVPLLESRTFYNPEHRTQIQIVPGLIGVILHLTMVLFTSIAIVRERERGNLELLITTPVKTGELMLGKILPYVGIGLVQVSIILFVGAWLFDIPLRGSLLELYVAAAVFIVATLALGLLLSTLANTQFQAMQLTVFTFLPSILLSGFMFPFEGMPRFAQWLGEVIPLTHFVRLIRGIVIRGADLTSMGGEMAAMGAFAAVMLALALARFHKRLD
ncbi:MAG: ABC transporter permease [Proteobacteria bacterium]|nr:ABC transporter permease [Pseudomonadota bacterium]